MRIQKLIMAILLLSVNLSAGCGATASIAVTYVTEPVMLGKKIKIHGTANEQWQLRVPFDISISDSGFGAHYFMGSKASPELLKLLDLSEDKIVIDEVYVGSYSFLLITTYGEKSWTDLKGGIYNKQTGGHESK
jgi:hypothetical protein